MKRKRSRVCAATAALRGKALRNQQQWPVTMDEAVGVVIATLSDEDNATMSAMAESDLMGL